MLFFVIESYVPFIYKIFCQECYKSYVKATRHIYVSSTSVCGICIQYLTSLRCASGSIAYIDAESASEAREAILCAARYNTQLADDHEVELIFVDEVFKPFGE